MPLILHVGRRRHVQALEIADTILAFRLALKPLEHRQEHRQQDKGNDDHREQLEERESAPNTAVNTLPHADALPP
jgi:hypothetical protein